MLLWSIQSTVSVIFKLNLCPYPHSGGSCGDRI